ncbi:MAG: DUF6261 family protein [Alistipes sp.]|jgi:hypothetical protein|nr:DUF6261 family protein [Alistipes sp.]
MKIDGLKLGHLRNDEHFQFMTEVYDAFREADPAALRVEAQFEAFAALYRVEDAVLKKITRSALTAEIHDADAERDRVFRGLADAVRSAANHFSPAVAEAAGRLRIVFDAYGNVARDAQGRACPGRRRRGAKITRDGFKGFVLFSRAAAQDSAVFAI